MNPLLRVNLAFAMAVLCSMVTSGRADPGPDDETETSFKARREADRAFVRGQEVGSLSNPRVLGEEVTVGALCDALQTPASAQPIGDAFERGRARHALKERRRDAIRRVYAAVVGPKGFKVGEYRFEKRILPLELDRAMVALDGGLLLNVIDPDTAGFSLTPMEASGLVAKIRDRQLTLRVVFRVEPVEDLAACFTYPKSEAYNLRIRPLAYELLQSDGASVARMRTKELSRLRSWLAPGAPKVRLSLQRIDGAIDLDGLTASAEAKRPKIEICLGPVMSSEVDTAVLSFTGAVSPGGQISSLHLQVESVKDEAIIKCLRGVIETIKAPRSAKASKVQLTVVVDRD